MSLERETMQKTARERLLTVLRQKGFDELAARKKEESEKAVGDKKDAAKTVFTPSEALVLAIGEALEFFDAHEQRVFTHGETSTFFEKSNGDKVPAHYVEACNAMRDLLEKPSVNNLAILVELASKIYGHRNWGGTIFAFLGIIGGIVLLLEFPILALILGTAVPLEQILIVGVALILLGNSIFMLVKSAPSDHSAELYKVEAAVKQLLNVKKDCENYSENPFGARQVTRNYSSGGATVWQKRMQTTLSVTEEKEQELKKRFDGEKPAQNGATVFQWSNDSDNNKAEELSDLSGKHASMKKI